MLIAGAPLIVSGDFGGSLTAAAVAAALAHGLRAGGVPPPDLCPIPAGILRTGELRASLQELCFDPRLRRSRALIVAETLLEEQTLAGRIAFEVATRARQAGVPAYAVAGRSRLGPFDARMLDLQAVLTGASEPALVAAGRKLADLI